MRPAEHRLIYRPSPVDRLPRWVWRVWTWL
jgi:hypothetical protein